MGRARRNQRDAQRKQRAKRRRKNGGSSDDDGDDSGEEGCTYDYQESTTSTSMSGGKKLRMDSNISSAESELAVAESASKMIETRSSTSADSEKHPQEHGGEIENDTFKSTISPEIIKTNKNGKTESSIIGGSDDNKRTSSQNEPSIQDELLSSPTAKKSNNKSQPLDKIERMRLKKQQQKARRREKKAAKEAGKK